MLPLNAAKSFRGILATVIQAQRTSLVGDYTQRGMLLRKNAWVLTKQNQGSPRRAQPLDLGCSIATLFGNSLDIGRHYSTIDKSAYCFSYSLKDCETSMCKLKLVHAKMGRNVHFIPELWLLIKFVSRWWLVHLSAVQHASNCDLLFGGTAYGPVIYRSHCVSHYYKRY